MTESFTKHAQFARSCALLFWALSLAGCGAADPEPQADGDPAVQGDESPAAVSTSDLSFSLHYYCCQLTVVGDPQPSLCTGYHTFKAVAVAKCAAEKSLIPGTIPTLASGQCSQYPACTSF